MTMQEVAEAAKIITSSADDNAKVIFGAVIDETLGETLRISVIATGFGDRERRSAPNTEDEFTIGLTRKKPLYSSGIFTKKRSLEKSGVEMEEMARPTGFTSKPVSLPPPIPTVATDNPTLPQQSKKGDPEDDLEIPAFIRRKMGI
jgi:cell division protein FtsZ